MNCPCFQYQHGHTSDELVFSSAAQDSVTGDGVAVKKVTNVFSKKILAKRALREIKLLQHFRGHRNVCLICLPFNGFRYVLIEPIGLTFREMQITCLYDMDIPRPDNFNETYLYEGRASPLAFVSASRANFVSFPNRIDGM